jgi:hypothetical protein
VRRLLAPLLVVAAEVGIYLRYAAFGAEFHYWLHGLFGAALGFLLVAALRLAGRRPPTAAVWVAGLLAHLVSSTPDALYLNLGVVHVRWMDVFAFHISIHFVDRPLLVVLMAFVGALAAWGAAVLRRPALALSCSALVVLVAAGALATRAPIPSSLAEVREQAAGRLICVLPQADGP